MAENFQNIDDETLIRSIQAKRVLVKSPGSGGQFGGIDNTTLLRSIQAKRGASLTPANVVRQFGQGATFFGADEAEAAIRAPFSERTFGEIVDDIRAQNAAFEEEFPKTAFGLQVGGGLATGGFGAVKVLGSQVVKQAPKFLRRLAVPAVGAAEGGLAGFGAAEGTPLERLPS